MPVMCVQVSAAMSVTFREIVSALSLCPPLRKANHGRRQNHGLDGLHGWTRIHPHRGKLWQLDALSTSVDRSQPSRRIDAGPVRPARRAGSQPAAPATIVRLIAAALKAMGSAPEI